MDNQSRSAVFWIEHRLAGISRIRPGHVSKGYVPDPSSHRPGHAVICAVLSLRSPCRVRALCDFPRRCGSVCAWWLLRWRCAAGAGVSVCAAGLFLVCWVPACAGVPGWARRGLKDGGCGGTVGGTLVAVGRGAPVVSPRREVSRPKAVRCRGSRQAPVPSSGRGRSP
jgi:hypothetical protein